MSDSTDTGDRRVVPPPYRTIARQIGFRLRAFYEQPEAEALPDEHVELLLRLRHKERDRERQA